MARWRITLLPLILTGLMSAGCGSRAPPPADAEKARQALTAALEGWQKGQKELAWDGQAVTLRDSRFKAGAKLIAFKVSDDQAYGHDRQFRVALKVRDKQGRSRDEQVAYNVRTAPAAVINRVDDD